MFFFNDKQKSFDTHSLLDYNLNLNSIPYKWARQFHYLIFKQLVEILDIVYSDYPIDNFFFIPVDGRLEDLFNHLHHIYEWINFHKPFQELQIISITGFRLVGDFNHYISMWANLKEDYYRDVELLSKNNPVIYFNPPDLELAFKEIDELLKEHAAKKHRELKANKLITDTQLLDFGAEDSITKTVYKILLEHKGEYVSVRKLANETGKDDLGNIRAVIGELKKKIRKQGKSHLLRIEPSKKGSYKLIISL